MSLETNTKNLLKSYNSILASCENIKEQLLNMDYVGLKVSKIDGMPYNPSGASITEIEALIVISKKNELISILNRNRRIIRIIDRALESLDEKEREVIVGYYIKNMSWDEISIAISHATRHCYRIRNEAIRKISQAIYGHLDFLEK